MARLLINPALGGNSDYYGTFALFNNAFTGNVISGMNVTQNSSPNMTVQVQPGQAFIREGTNPGQISYHAVIDTAGGDAVTVATANGSNPRNDFVVGYVDKSVTPTGTNNPNVYKLAYVSGTASATPADPTTSQIQAVVGATNPFDVYARVRMTTGATQVTTNMIDDLRAIASPKIDMTTMPKRKFMYNTSGVFVAPFSGYVRITMNSDAHNTGGSAVSVTVNCTSGSAIKAGALNYQTVDGSAGSQRSHTAISLFRNITAGSSYTFSGQATSGGLDWATFTNWEAEFMSTDLVQA